MALVKTGGGITDIQGSFGGVYFHRDKSGLHSCSKPRTVYRRSAAQKLQRDAFIAARRYTKDPRWVSYLMYRYMNGLPFIFDAIVTGWTNPDCAGKYELAGTHGPKDYYKRTDSVYFIWWNGLDDWYISDTLDVIVGGAWERESTNIEGEYQGIFGNHGNPVVTLSVTPPPLDYQIPKL